MDSLSEATPAGVVSIKTDVVRDTAWFGIATYLAQALGLISAVLIRRYLGPAGMGLWTALMLIPTYTNYSHLGVLNAAEREIPFLYGKQDWQKAAVVRNVAFTATLLAALASTVVLLVLAARQDQVANAPDVATGFRLIIVVVWAQLGFAFYSILARAAKRFKDLGLLTLLSAIVNIVAIVVLASRFGVPGMLLATGVAYSFMIAYLVLCLKLPVRLLLPQREIRRLMAIGLPIMVYGVMNVSLMNIDKITTVALLGTTSLGFYTLATMVKTYAWTVPSVIGMVMYPRLQERYGATGDPLHLKNMFLFPLIILAAFTPIFIGTLFFGTQFLAYTFLPDYASGLDSVRNIVIGTFFLAITVPAAQLMITLNKQLVLVAVSGVGIALAWGLNVLLIRRGMGIAGVALGTSCAYFITATVTIGLAARHYIFTLGGIVRLLARTYLPFLYASLALFTIDLAWPAARPTVEGTVLVITAKLLVFLVASLPLVWYANRQTGIVILLRDALLARWRRASRKK